LANRYPLRAYDAVQLATAWLADRNLVRFGQSSLVFVCSDIRLAEIAESEGLKTENPSLHL
jgi:hypothetical protein